MNSRAIMFASMVVLLVFVWTQTIISGGFAVKTNVDSGWYEPVSEQPFNLHDRLTSKEPPLYPVLLKLVHAATGSYELVPYVQYALFSAAVLVVLGCLNVSGFSGWQSVVMCVPIVFSSVLTQYGSMVSAEIPAVAFALMADGFVLLIAARGPSFKRCAFLGFAILLACLARPAFLFLSLMCPVVILLVTPAMRYGVLRRVLGREAVVNLASAIGPLFLFSLLRLLLVGNFGIVSAGGINLAGFALNPAMFTASDTVGLPDAEMRGLGRAILAKRAEMFAAGAPAGRPEYVFDEVAILRQPIVDRVIGSYDPTIWWVSMPAARKFYHQPEDPNVAENFVATNAGLTRLSGIIIRSKPVDYFQWIVLAAGRGFQTVFRYEKGGRWLIGLSFVALLCAVVAPGFSALFRLGSQPSIMKASFLSLLLGLALTAVIDWRSWFNVIKNVDGVVRGSILAILFPLCILGWACALTSYVFVRSMRNRPVEGLVRLRRPLGFATLAAGHFLFGLLLVVMVEMPLERYIIALSPLLPGAVLLLTITVVLELTGVPTFARRAKS